MISAFIKSVSSWLFSQVVVALIVWAIYSIILKGIIGINLNPLHWIGIVTIISLVFPAGRPNSTEKTVKDKNKGKFSIEDFKNY
jgi:hypothetical protein